MALKYYCEFIGLMWFRIIKLNLYIKLYCFIFFATFYKKKGIVYFPIKWKMHFLPSFIFNTISLKNLCREIC